MDRIFLDANVLFSAVYSLESGLAKLWHRRGVRLLASEYVIEEARRNLEAAEPRARLEVLLQRIERVADPAAALDPEGESRLPESDRPVLRAAIAGRATHLLSGDRRAFSRSYGQRVAGILILRPADYLERRKRAARG